MFIQKKERNTCTCSYSKERNTDHVTNDNKNIFCKDGSKLLSHFLEYRSDFIYLYFLFCFFSGKKNYLSVNNISATNANPIQFSLFPARFVFFKELPFFVKQSYI